MLNVKCKHCKFYSPYREIGTEGKHKAYGQCREDSPKVIGYSTQRDDKGPMSFFPEVLENEWCGKYQPDPYSPPPIPESE